MFLAWHTDWQAGEREKADSHGGAYLQQKRPSRPVPGLYLPDYGPRFNLPSCQPAAEPTAEPRQWQGGGRRTSVLLKPLAVLCIICLSLIDLWAKV